MNERKITIEERRRREEKTSRRQTMDEKSKDSLSGGVKGAGKAASLGGKAGKAAAKAAVKSPKLFLVVFCGFFLIVLLCSMGAGVTAQAQTDDIFYLTPEGSTTRLPEDKEEALFDREAALKATKELTEEIDKRRDADAKEMIEEIKAFLLENEYDEELSIELLSEDLADSGDLGTYRLLAAFSISQGNGNLSVKDGALAGPDGEIIEGLDLTGGKVDYKKSLEKALDKYLFSGKHFFEISYEKENGKIKVYEKSIIHKEMRGGWIIDPDTGEERYEEWEVIWEEKIPYVHPYLLEKGEDGYMAELFDLNLNDKYINSGDTELSQITVGEAIDILAKGTRAILFDEYDGKLYESGLLGIYEWPCPEHFTITSVFGNRIDPVTGIISGHNGTDISCSIGSEVAACEKGFVIYAGYLESYGYNIKVKHEDGRITRYAHLSSARVYEGQSVEKGQVIALSGNTGKSTGPHLHIEVIEEGNPVDPLPYICSKENYSKLKFK